MKYLVLVIVTALCAWSLPRLDLTPSAAARGAVGTSTGASLAGLPLGQAFSVEFDLTTFPNVSFPYGNFANFSSGKNFVYTVPMGQAIVLTNVEYYAENNNNPRLEQFVVGVAGVVAYRRGENNSGSVGPAPMSPIVIREGQEMRIHGRTPLGKATVVLQGYLLAMSDL